MTQPFFHFTHDLDKAAAGMRAAAGDIESTLGGLARSGASGAALNDALGSNLQSTVGQLKAAFQKDVQEIQRAYAQAAKTGTGLPAGTPTLNQAVASRSRVLSTALEDMVGAYSDGLRKQIPGFRATTSGVVAALQKEVAEVVKGATRAVQQAAPNRAAAQAIIGPSMLGELRTLLAPGRISKTPATAVANGQGTLFDDTASTKAKNERIRAEGKASDAATAAAASTRTNTAAEDRASANKVKAANEAADADRAKARSTRQQPTAASTATGKPKAAPTPAPRTDSLTEAVKDGVRDGAKIAAAGTGGPRPPEPPPREPFGTSRRPFGPDEDPATTRAITEMRTIGADIDQKLTRGQQSTQRRLPDGRLEADDVFKDIRDAARRQAREGVLSRAEGRGLDASDPDVRAELRAVDEAIKKRLDKVSRQITNSLAKTADLKVSDFRAGRIPTQLVDEVGDTTDNRGRSIQLVESRREFARREVNLQRGAKISGKDEFAPDSSNDELVGLARFGDGDLAEEARNRLGRLQSQAQFIAGYSDDYIKFQRDEAKRLEANARLEQTSRDKVARLTAVRARRAERLDVKEAREEASLKILNDPATTERGGIFTNGGRRFSRRGDVLEELNPVRDRIAQDKMSAQDVKDARKALERLFDDDVEDARREIQKALERAARAEGRELRGTKGRLFEIVGDDGESAGVFKAGQAGRQRLNPAQEAIARRAEQDFDERQKKQRDAQATRDQAREAREDADAEVNELLQRSEQVRQAAAANEKAPRGKNGRPLGEPSLSQAFVGGLTSSGFGANANDFDPAGLARSFGSTVKFAAQYEALTLVRTAFIDTIREAIDYRDSLTDLNLALGEGERASAQYVDGLSEISKLAGGNVGQALDAAARGVRAFTDPTSARFEKDAAGETSAREARNLSIITGQTIPDAMGDLVAIGQSFELELTELGSIADAVALAKGLGGDPNQILQGLANASVALNAAGFDAAEGAQLISGVIANLNESGQAAATRISRIVSSASSSTGRSLFRGLGINPDAGAKQSLLELAKLYENNELSAAQMQQALNTLGGGSNLREFKASLTVLNDEMEGFTNGFDSAGKAEEEVERKTKDLAGRLKELVGTIKNVQNELFDSGAFAPLMAAFAALQPMLTTIETLLKLFNRLSEAIDNLGPNKANGDPFDIGGITATDAAVGIGQVLLAMKALQLYRRAAAPEAQLLRGLEKALTKERIQSRIATEAAAGAESKAALASNARVAQIREEIVALKALQVANRQAEVGVLRQVGGVPGRARDRWRNVRNGGMDIDDGAAPRRRGGAVGGFLGDLVGFGGKFGTAVGAIAAVTIATEIGNAVKGTFDTRRRTQADASNALFSLGADQTPGDSVQALRDAAEARRRAGEGFFANFFDRNADEEAKALDKAADNEEKRRDARKAEDAARAETPDRFDDIFGDARSIENLSAGFQTLDANGASAARQMQLLADALSDVGDPESVGVVAPGAAGRIADAVGGLTFEALERVISDSISDQELASTGKVDRPRNQANAGLVPLGPVDENDPLFREPSKKQREQESKEERKFRENLQEEREKQTRETLDKLPNLKGEKRSETLARAAKQLQDGIEAAIGPRGGILTEAQMQELAEGQAELFVGDADLTARERKQFVAAVLDSIKEKTKAGGQPLTQEASNLLQGEAITKAGQVEQDATLLQRDPITGAEARIKVLADEAARARASGVQVNDNLLAEQVRAQKSLIDAQLNRAQSVADLAKAQAGDDDTITATQIDVDLAYQEWAVAVASGTPEEQNAGRARLLTALEAQRDAARENRNAIDQAGVDPRDSVGNAAVEVRVARRALADATDGSTAFYQAQRELARAQQGYADAVLEAQIAMLYTFDPRDQLAEARTNLEAARMRRAALDDPLTLQPGLNDFDTQGNPVGTIDPQGAGEGVGAQTIEGFLENNWQGTGQTAAQQLAGGFTGAMTDVVSAATTQLEALTAQAVAAAQANAGAGATSSQTAAAAAGVLVDRSAPSPVALGPLTQATTDAQLVYNQRQAETRDARARINGEDSASTGRRQQLQQQFARAQAAEAAAKAALARAQQAEAAAKAQNAAAQRSTAGAVGGVAAVGGGGATTGNSGALLNLLRSSGLSYRSADGSTVNRNVAGTTTTSQHAFGNAVDIFGTPQELAAITDHLKRYAGGLKELIYSGTNTFLGTGGRAFTPRAQTVRDHRDHIHVSANDSNALRNAVAAAGGDASQVRTAGSASTGGSTGGFGPSPAELAAERARADAEIRRQEQAFRDAIVANQNARLVSQTDPNNGFAQAETNLRTAQNVLRAQLPGQTAYYQALDAVRQAQLALSKAIIDRRNSVTELNAARVGGQVAAAASALEVARRNLATQARGTAEYNRAQAQVYEAIRANAEALTEATRVRQMGRIDITNPVAVARLNTAVANRRRNEAVARGDAPDVVAGLDLQVREAQNAEEAAAFQQRLSDAQINDQLGRTSHAAYIRYLQSEHDRLSAIGTRTRQQQDQLNEIDLALKAASEQMSGMWNIGDIKIPTIYEVRRSIAEAGAATDPARVGPGLTSGPGPFRSPLDRALRQADLVSAAPISGAMATSSVSALAPVTTVTNNNDTSTTTVHLTINGGDLNQVRAVLEQYLGSSALQRSSVSTAKV